MAINMNSIPTQKPAMSAIIPKGSYVAKIVKAQMKTPKDDSKPDYFSAECDITDPSSNTAMGKFWINLYESEAPLVRYQLGRFIKALNLNIQGEFELKDLTKMVNNKSLIVDICPEDKPEPQRSVVDISAECFYPVEKVAEKSDMDALEEDVAEALNTPVEEAVPTVQANY